MQNAFDEVSRQIHEIRNLVGPVHLKMADLETRILDYKTHLDEKNLTLESRVLGALFKIEKHDLKIADIVARQEKILERLKSLENRKT